MGMPVTPTWNLDDYAFYDSTGTGTPVGDGAQTTLEVDTTYYCVIAVTDTTSNGAYNFTAQWQYNLAGGGWTDVGTGAAAVNYANGSLTDGGSPGDDSAVAGGGTYNGSRVYESENDSATAFSTPEVDPHSDTYGEVWLGFTIDSGSVTNGQEILLRVVLGDNTTITENVNPDIDVLEVSPITATASVTEAADTLSATGSRERTGTANITENADTISSAGAVSIDGITNVTENADTCAANAAVEINGTANVTENADTCIAAGSSSIDATANVTEANDTVATAALVEITGSANITEADDTITSTAQIFILGNANITELADTLSAVANVLNIVYPSGIEATVSVGDIVPIIAPTLSGIEASTAQNSTGFVLTPVIAGLEADTKGPASVFFEDQNDTATENWTEPTVTEDESWSEPTVTDNEDWNEVA